MKPLLLPSAKSEAVVPDVERASKKTKLSFSDKFAATLDHFEFPDADVVAPHFHSDPSKGRQNWLQLVNGGRNITARQGYVNFRPGGSDMRERVIRYYQLSRHLHDILVRLILYEYGYNGHYQPRVSEYTDLQPVNWVTPDSRPDHLGYR